jgi:hypothetical protein
MQNSLEAPLAVVTRVINKLPPSLIIRALNAGRTPYQGQIRACGMVRQYTEREDLLMRDGDVFLLLGLAGLLEFTSHTNQLMLLLTNCWTLTSLTDMTITQAQLHSLL